MTLSEFIEKVRFLFSDTVNSNIIYRESLVSRPGNVIDGNNKIFYLLNRRIAVIHSLYDRDGVEVPAANYVLLPERGRLTFVNPPTTPLFVDYAWQKLTDAEIMEAVKLAAASGGFDFNNVPDSMADFATHFTVAYCFTSAASRAAEYYTLSASGKHVAKSELYNHYVALAEQFTRSGEKLRTDYFTGRGTRDVPAGEDSGSDWATPYFPSDGGF